MEDSLRFCLYPIVDVKFLETQNITEEYLKRLLQNLDFFQLRIKNKTKNEVLDLLKNFYKKFNKKIILNDYYDLLDFVDGIHLGIEDLYQFDLKEKVSEIKEKYNFAKNLTEFLLSKDKLIFGISTHNFLQFSKIYEEFQSILGYLAIGPVNSTTTKIVEYPVINQEELNKILTFIITNQLEISIVLIGGIEKSVIEALYHTFYNFKYFNNKTIYFASISNFLNNKIPICYP